MGVAVENSSGLCRIKLDGSVRVKNAEEIKAALVKSLGEFDDFEIDLSDVEDIDTTGLQILLALSRCEGKAIRFVNHSDAVLRALELANLINKFDGHSNGLVSDDTEKRG